MPERSKNLKQEVGRLAVVLDDLHEKLSRQVHLPYVFVSAVVKGVGYAIGATLVASILLAVLSRTVSTLGDLPFIGELIDQGFVESVERPGRSLQQER